MSDTAGGSQGSIAEANRSRAAFSRHGGLGAAGFISPYDKSQPGTFLSRPGDVSIVNTPSAGLPDFFVGVAWDNVVVERETNPIKRFFRKKIKKAGVDIDLGCLYELKNGTRGGMQAFGDIHGSLGESPWIFLSGDERRGDREGPDEIIRINGAHWNDIERILLYVYIYDGARNWDFVRPQIQVCVPGEQPMVVALHARKKDMSVCAVAQIENIRGGIKLTSVLEYYPGHAEMDRSFGFGIDWESGRKDE